jgi:hypothetical protein
VFQATVSDNEDLPNEVTLSWESDIDGVFSTDGADSSGEVTVSADSLSAGDQVVTVTATDTDGLFVAETVSFNLNVPPVVTDVRITPDPAYNDDTLVCSATVTDLDGETPTLSYRWTGGATGSELPLTSIIAASGDTLTCTATADDGDGGTAVGSASITLGNRNPTVSLSLAPDAPTMHDTLTCTASSTDPDGGSPSLSFTWTVGDTPVTASSTLGTISTLAGVFLAGQTVACQADVDDGKGGTATDTASVIIGNTAPEVASVTLTPSELYTNDTVTAIARSTDADGDSPTLSYAFSVDDEVVQDGSSDTLDGAVHFDKHQTIYVTVTAEDDTDSASLASDTVTVLNTPPTAPVVDIVAIEELDCAPGWTLASDGDRCLAGFSTPVSAYTARDSCASFGGQLVTIRSAEEEAEVSDLLPGEYFWHGITDEAEEGSWVWSTGETATYTNWGPGEPNDCCGGQDCAHAGQDSTWDDVSCETTSLSYVCEIPGSLASLTCIIKEESTDDDGETPTYTFDWDVDGTPFTDTETTTYEGDTVPGDALGTFETWTCDVTPDDGEDDGEIGSAEYVQFDLDCAEAEYEGREYHFCTTPMEWGDAEEACTGIGGNLATTRNSAQYSWLLTTSETVLPKASGGYWWIGYNDIDSEGDYVWSSGSPSTFTDWAVGEPNDSYSGATEDCAVMKHPDKPAGWNDLPCDGFDISSQGFICEVTPDLPCPGGSADISSPGDLIPYLSCTELDGVSLHMTSGIDTVSLPLLEEVHGSVYFHQNNDVRYVDFPLLRTVEGHAYFHQNYDLESISLPSLESVDAYLYFYSNELLSTLELTDSLSYVGEYINLSGSPLLCPLDLDWDSIAVGGASISGLASCEGE